MSLAQSARKRHVTALWKGACGDWDAQVVGKVDLPAFVRDMMFLPWKNVR